MPAARGAPEQLVHNWGGAKRQYTPGTPILENKQRTGPKLMVAAHLSCFSFSRLSRPNLAMHRNIYAPGIIVHGGGARCGSNASGAGLWAAKRNGLSQIWNQPVGHGGLLV